jgi:hypothetical protein
MINRVVELYYSVAELSLLLRFSEKKVREWVKEGKFSSKGDDGAPDFSNIVEIAGELRVPASGVSLFLENHRLVYDMGVKARNRAELKRKLQSRTAVQMSGLEEKNG